MNRPAYIIGVFSIALFFACGSDHSSSKNTSADSSTATTTEPEDPNAESTDPRGVGKYTHVELASPLNQERVKGGQQIYDVKCASCHKLTDERVVGPGWKGVTKRRTPEWIMNFITNTEVMLKRDTASRNMLEICLVEMPNQHLEENHAYSVLEFMRSNDGEK
jgi:cytochrome c